MTWHSINRQKSLLVNLIRGILMKNFKECGSSAVNATDLSQQNTQRDIDTENCCMKPRSAPVDNSILKSVYKAQQLIQQNYNAMEKLNEDNVDTKKVLKDWSAGSTALDFSIMLSFLRIRSSRDKCESVYHLQLNDNDRDCRDFLVNATIVDLDFKKDSIAHFQKYKKQLKESKLAYKEFMDARNNDGQPWIAC